MNDIVEPSVEVPRGAVASSDAPVGASDDGPPQAQTAEAFEAEVAVG